jgi:hypothetical protein
MKKLFSFTMILAAALLVSFPAAAQCPYECCTDEDCDYGMICTVDNYCDYDDYGDCVDDSDCDEGYICMDGWCEWDEDYGYCDTSADCPEGQICVWGYCEDEGSGYCETDADCPEGYFCMEYYCEEGGSDYCMDDSHCPPGYICMDGYCEEDGFGYCDTDADCPPGQTCEDGYCMGGFQLCDDDSDCPAGQICDPTMFYCVPGSGGCQSDYDCQQGQVCVDGNCVDGGSDQCSQEGLRECVNDSSFKECGDFNADGHLEWSDPDSCADGQVCQNGDCLACGQEDQPCCAAESCDDGMRCVAGTCRPSSDCEDDCTRSGERQCFDDESYQVCGDFDDDWCFEWGPPENCGAGESCQGAGSCGACGGNWQDCCPGNVCNDGLTCSSGTCSEGGSDCTDDCSMFTAFRECVGTASYRECGLFDDDPCLDWGPETQCDAGNICSSGSCIPDPDCGDDCNNEGDPSKRCTDDTHYQDCLELIGNSCVVWGDPAACPDGQVCEGNGNCVSNCQAGTLDVCNGIDDDCDGYVDEDDDCAAGSSAASGGCGCAGVSGTGLPAGLMLLLLLLVPARMRRR